ncbi:MAG: PAS domain S-box protein [candidate division Zixibacteria bacterium]|nr:PAS domain S-box protein [candidate division Zixibacteria bacterium]
MSTLSSQRINDFTGFRHVLDIVDLPVFITSQERVVYVNAGFEDFTGHRVRDILGEKTNRFVAGGYLSDLREIDRKLSKKELIQLKTEIEIEPAEGRAQKLGLTSVAIEWDQKPSVLHLLNVDPSRLDHSGEDKFILLQRIIDAIPSPIFYKNASLVYEGCNLAFENYIGMKREDIIGKTVYDLAPRELAEKYDKMDRQLLKSLGTQNYEAQVEFADGSIHDVMFNKAIYSDSKGEIAGMIGVMLDITDRKRSEEQVRYRYKMESALSYISRLFLAEDKTDMKGILAIIDNTFNTDFTYIYRLSSESNIFRLDDSFSRSYNDLIHTLPDIIARDSIGNDSGLLQKTGAIQLDSRNPQQCNKLCEELKLAERESATLLVLPIISSEAEMIGFIGIEAISGSRKWLYDELQVLRLIVEKTSIYWDKQNTLKYLKESEEQFREAFEQAAVGIAHVDMNGMIIKVNQRFCEIIGYLRDELYNLSFKDITHPDDVGQDLENIELLLENKISKYSLEKRYVKKDGSEVWVNLTTTLLRDKHGNPSQFLGAVEDITKRKQAEDALERSVAMIRATLESTSDGIMVTGLDGRIINYNQRFINMWDLQNSSLCLDEDGCILDTLRTHMVNPEKFDRYYYQPAHVDARNKNIELELNDGRVFELNCLPLVASGKSDGIVWSFHDVTHQKEAESVLERVINQYTTMIDSVPAVLFAKDKDLRYTVVNRAFCEKANMDKDSIVGKTASDIYSREMAEHFSKLDQDVLTRNRAIINREEKQAFDGETNWISMNKVPLQDSSGETVGLVGMYQDITEQRRSRDQLMQSDKLAAIGTLAAGVAHEINNPMGYISSNLNTMDRYTGILKQFILDNCESDKDELEEIVEILDDLKSAIGESVDGATRVKDIVADLKSFSRVDKAEETSSDINEGIKSTLNIVWNELKYHCKVETDYGDLPDIKCMPNQLNQVFLNLLINAGQAIKHKNGLIKIRTYTDNDNIYISIKDNGEGISEKNLKKIFEPFYTTKEVGKGTGLGLSLVFDIIKKHNGDIAVESEIGEGTEFVISLPLEGNDET